jgi:hypothetical protein
LTVVFVGETCIGDGLVSGKKNSLLN